MQGYRFQNKSIPSADFDLRHSAAFRIRDGTIDATVVRGAIGSTENQCFFATFRFLVGRHADAFCELIKKALTLGTFQNDTVHAWWYADVNGLPSRIRPKRASHQSADWTRGRIVKVSEIRSAREEIERICRDLDTQRGTWAVRNVGLPNATLAGTTRGYFQCTPTQSRSAGGRS